MKEIYLFTPYMITPILEKKITSIGGNVEIL